MSTLPPTSDRRPSPQDEILIDRLCNEFEDAWKANQPPPIEGFLDRVEPALREMLLRELVAIEMACRQEVGDTVLVDVYKARFPGLTISTIEGTSSRRAPTAPESDGIGDRLPLQVDNFELLEEIARGGMGIVYRARDIALNREVAVKVLQGRFRADSEIARRFTEEARITGQLQHPSIPAIHQVGKLPDGRPFLAMKLVKGRTLAELLGDDPDFGNWDFSHSISPWPFVPDIEPADRGLFIGVFEQICQAVGYAHARQVIHRDLKPANVMVGAFGEVQVMDWGLAKVLGEKPSRLDVKEVIEETTLPTKIRSGRDPDSATEFGSVFGTLAFMSPEQAGGEIEKLGPPSDVFSLGAILCVILTGHPPYRGANAEEIRLLAVRGKLEFAFMQLDLSGFRGAHPALIALAKRCMAFEPADRPAHAGIVAAAVAEMRTTAQVRVRQAEMDQVRAEERAHRLETEQSRADEQRKRKRSQRNLAATTVGLVVLTVFGFALGVQWLRADRARDAAESARRDAEVAREAEKQARERLAVVEYGRTMNLGHQEWRDNRVDAALVLLNGTQPDLRGWEWGYLDRQCNAHLLRFEGHPEAIVSACFSGDGLWIVTSSHDRTVADKTVTVRNAKTGRVVTLKGHTDNVGAASFNRDATLIVTGSTDRTARIWDAKTGAAIHSLEGHSDTVVSASFSADGLRVVAGGLDRTARVWDVSTGKEALPPLKGHMGIVRSASFNPDGSLIVTGSSDKTAIVWDATNGLMKRTLEGHGGAVESVAFSPDGSRIVTGSGDRSARVWETTTGKEILTLNGHDGPIGSVAYNSDGSRIATGSTDRTAKVWDAKYGREIFTVRGHSASVMSVSFSPDGSRLVTRSFDKTAKVWDATRSAEAMTLRGTKHLVTSVEFSPDGSRIATGSDDGTAIVWNANTGNTEHTFNQHTGKITSVSFSADGKWIVTGGIDRTANVWNATTGAVLQTLAGPAGHTNSVLSVASNGDGSRIVTGSNDRMAKLWDVSTGKVLHTLSEHNGPVTGVAFSPDGLWVATASEDSTVRLWDSASGSNIRTLDGHTKEATSVSFSADGLWIVTGCRDRTARVFDVRTGKLEHDLTGHTNAVTSARFSADGSRIVSGSEDGTSKVWDAKTGAEVFTLRGHTGTVSSAAFSADGSRIVTGSRDGTAKVWDSRPMNRESLPKQPAPPPR